MGSESFEPLISRSTLEADRVAEVARRKAEDEANRARYLDQRGNGEEATWHQIAVHIQERQPNEYDKAITLLIDLRDLAVRQGRVTAFQSALEGLRRTHAAKESFLRRLTKGQGNDEGTRSEDAGLAQLAKAAERYLTHPGGNRPPRAEVPAPFHFPFRIRRAYIRNRRTINPS